MSIPYPDGGYSAEVDLRLRVNGCVFPLAQAGNDRVIFDHPTALPEGPAEIVVIVDGHESRRAVRIDNRSEPRRIVPIILEPTP